MDESNVDTKQPERSSMNWKKTLLISLGVLLLGGLVLILVFLTEPTAQRAGATKKTAMLVEVVEAKRDTFQPVIIATGTVEPARDIVLSPRVSGEIIERSEVFTPGGFVKKGEVLLRIDPSDYQNTLELRKSNLQQAIADLNIEMGRQDVAQKDFQLVDEELTEENKALVLREPQLQAVRSRVKAARASVNQARLDLQRTTIKAPFNAHILSRNVNIGSQVSPGNNLGRLVGMDNYWVALTIPLSKLPWLSFPEDENTRGAEVKLRNRTAWPEGMYRKGYLYKLVGTLEDKTRMARVLVTVPDPLAHRTDSAELPRLMIGAFMEAQIQAREIPDVIRLNRDYIRKDETVWVMKEGKLQIREADIIFRDQQYAYIRKGLEEGEKVLTTNLSTVVEGAALRTAATDTSAR